MFARTTYLILRVEATRQVMYSLNKHSSGTPMPLNVAVHFPTWIQACSINIRLVPWSCNNATHHECYGSTNEICVSLVFFAGLFFLNGLLFWIGANNLSRIFFLTVFDPGSQPLQVHWMCQCFNRRKPDTWLSGINVKGATVKPKILLKCPKID